MKKLLKLFKKKKKTVIGLMSGTSLDGIDASLVEIENSGIKTKFKELFFRSYPYPQKLKEMLLRNSSCRSSSVDDISTLNVLVAKFYVKAVINLCREYGINTELIDLIGAHGQTIHHLPEKKYLFGQEVSSTLQIGDISTIAKLTGIPTVGDFRLADMALGGQGAPLVPYFDYISFRSNKLNRALLNIGGISNITFLKKKCLLNEVIAFDTGPGNIMIDLLMKKLYHKNMDKEGKMATSGKVHQRLFNRIVKLDPFMKNSPPKSTGRELYNIQFINKVMKGIKNISKKDIITTFSEYSAYTIFYNYQTFLRREGEIDEMIVSGGGAKNNYIISSLKKYFSDGVKITVLDNKEMTSDSKEATCFAILANETISGNPANIISVTGALQTTVLGKISY